jgi:hypothetical protein
MQKLQIGLLGLPVHCASTRCQPHVKQQSLRDERPRRAMHPQRRRRCTEACGRAWAVECFTRRGTAAAKEPPRHERHPGELFGWGVDLLINRRA